MNQLQIRMLLLHVTQNCNSPCIMCDCWKTKEKVELKLSDLKLTLDLFIQNGGELVMISGGEPTLHSDLTSILDYCKKFSLKVALNTNGILLQKKIDILASSVSFIVISLDASNRKLYNEIRGVDAFDKIIENVKFIKNRYPNLKIQFRCTISRKNLFNVVDIINLAKSLSVDGVGFSPIDYDSKSFSRISNTPDSLDLLIPTIQEIQKFEDLLLGEWKPKLLEFKELDIITWSESNFLDFIRYIRNIREDKTENIPNCPTCFFPYTSILVDYDGSLRGCFYSKAFSNINNITKEKFVDINRIKNIEAESICSTCRGRVFT